MKYNGSIYQFVLLLILFMFYAVDLKSEVNLTGFEWDNYDWIKTGDTNRIADDYNIFYQGKKSIRLGGVKSGIKRKLDVSMLDNVDFAAFVKINNSINDSVTIYTSYYDSLDNEIIQYKSSSADTNWRKIFNYTIVPPFTKYVIIGFEFISNNENHYCNIDYCYWNSDAMYINENTEINYHEYLKPFWASDTVFNETILMMSYNGGLARANLLYQPSKIISITNYDKSKIFIENIDYNLENNNIIATQNSRMNYFIDSLININNYWFSLYKKDNEYYPQWIQVTYLHKRNWKNISLPNKLDKLPKTLAKLKNKDSELKIAAIGMSVTKGCSVTGLTGYYPYMPTYFTLFCNYLGINYKHNNIKSYNVAVPGAKVNEFGINCFEKYLNPLNPDLLIIDFGNVDFWELVPSLYKENIIKIIEKGRSFNPNIEYILVSNNLFDPAFLQDTNQSYIKQYYLNLRGYQKVLKELEEIGVVNVDINTLSDSLIHWKKAKDLLVDPLHPNDYMARWYAQALISTFVPIMNGSINKIVNRSNQLVLDNIESKVSQSQVDANEIVISNKQDWEFYKLSNGNNRILSNDSKLALTVENGDLIQTLIKDTSSQEWELIPLDNQFYKLKNLANQQYLTIDTISNKIKFQPLSNNPAQEWNIYYSYKKEELNTDKDTTHIERDSDSSHFIQIESNTKWTVTSSSKWLHFNKTEGNGNKTLKLIIDENIDKMQRVATIDVTTNSLTKKHYVIQNGSKTSINDNTNNENKLKFILPNEQENSLYLYCEECKGENIKIEIFDLLARNCMVVNAQIANTLKVNLDKLTKGQYFVKVDIGQVAIVKKIQVY